MSNSPIKSAESIYRQLKKTGMCSWYTLNNITDIEFDRLQIMIKFDGYQLATDDPLLAILERKTDDS